MVAHLILPQVQVDLRQTPAGNPLIEELVILVKCGLLDLVDHIRVLADNLGQGGLPDLSQLGLSEPHRRVRGLVPEPVALLRFLELDPKHAGKGWTDQGALERNLTQTTCEEVNIFHREVDLLQSLNHVLTR